MGYEIVPVLERFVALPAVVMIVGVDHMTLHLLLIGEGPEALIELVEPAHDASLGGVRACHCDVCETGSR